MGFYQDHVLPRLQDKTMVSSACAAVRARVCVDLKGDVVEIGFGTGRNVRCYPV